MSIYIIKNFPVCNNNSGLRCCSKNQKVPVQTPLGARPGLGTQPHYEAPDDPRVENAKRSD